MAGRIQPKKERGLWELLPGPHGNLRIKLLREFSVPRTNNIDLAVIDRENRTAVDQLQIRLAVRLAFADVIEQFRRANEERLAPVVKCATALKRAVLISVADLEGERPPGQSTILIRSWEEADLKIWPAALAVLVGQHRLAKRHAVFSVLRSAEQILLDAWLDRVDTLEDAIDLHFDALEQEDLSLPLRFQLFVQAIEAAHRRSGAPAGEPINVDVVVETLRERSVADGMIDRVRGMLAHAHEPGLRQRLRAYWDAFAPELAVLRPEPE